MNAYLVFFALGKVARGLANIAVLKKIETCRMATEDKAQLKLYFDGYLKNSIYLFRLSPIIRAGFPATIAKSGTSLVTMAPIPMTA